MQRGYEAKERSKKPAYCCTHHFGSDHLGNIIPLSFSARHALSGRILAACMHAPPTFPWGIRGNA